MKMVDSKLIKCIQPVTSDHDLIELAGLIGVHLDGIYTINEINKPLESGTYLILLGHEGSVGHWVCVNNGQYFDPIGEGAPTKLGDLPYSQFQYQSTYGEYCGVWCLFWLYCQQINRLGLLKGFTDLNINAI